MAEPHISRAMGIAMIVVAVGVDVLEIGLDLLFGIGLFVNPIIDFCANVGFSMWFSHHDVSIWRKSPGWLMITTLVDFIPGGDFAFPWTLFVSFTVAKNKLSPAASEV